MESDPADVEIPARSESQAHRNTAEYAPPEHPSTVPATHDVNDLRLARSKRRLVDAATYSLPIVAGAVIIASLRASAVVTMPLAVAVFLVILVWPVYSYLRHRTARWLAIVGSLVALGAIMGTGVALLYWSVKGFVSNLPLYAETLNEVIHEIEDVFPNAGSLRPSEGSSQMLRTAVTTAAIKASIAFLIAIFTILAVSEVGRWRRKIEMVLAERQPTLVSTFVDVGHRFRQYMWTRVLMSIATAISTGLICVAFGVPDAILWSVVAFLLNFIPNIGSLVAVIPPTMVALTQLGTRNGLIFLAVLTTAQIIWGKFVEPKMQGKALRLSPLIVLLSVVFWGWVWGIGGALLSVPITVFLVALAEKSPRWSWISELVGEPEQNDNRPPPETFMDQPFPTTRES